MLSTVPTGVRVDKRGELSRPRSATCNEALTKPRRQFGGTLPHMFKIAIHRLLILALVVLTSFAHLSPSQPLAWDRLGDAPVSVAVAHSVSQMHSAAHGHSHASAEHAHAVTGTPSSLRFTLAPREHHTLKINTLSRRFAIDLGLKRPPRT